LDNTYELRWLGVAISQGKKDTAEQERRIIKESAKQKKKKTKAVLEKQSPSDPVVMSGKDR